MKRQIRLRPQGLILPAGLILLTGLALLTTIPSRHLPGTDQGVFLYLGTHILQGKIPYRDMWDHKPPMIFFIDALGLLIGGGSRWGVWLMDWLSLSATSLAGVYFLKKYFKPAWAILAWLAALVTLTILLALGNVTEGYALAFQMASLLLFAQIMEGKRSASKGIMLGVLLGLAFLTKQTMVGIWIAMAAYLAVNGLARRDRASLRTLIQMAGGALAILAVTALYFTANHALGSFWDAAFHYNLAYSSAGLADRLLALIGEIDYTTSTSFYFTLAFIAWLVGVAYLLLHSQRAMKVVTHPVIGYALLVIAVFMAYKGLMVSGFQLYDFRHPTAYRLGLVAAAVMVGVIGAAFAAGWISKKAAPFGQRYQIEPGSPILMPIWLAVINLPIELAFIGVSARNYTHYFITLIPVTMILIAFFIDFFITLPAASTRDVLSVVWCFGLMIPVFLPGLVNYAQRLQPSSDLQRLETVAYIQKETTPKDTVLLWGRETLINFLSGRDSPSRYTYLTPFYTPGFVNARLAGELLVDLQKNKPLLIIDTKDETTPFMTMDEQGKCSPIQPETAYELGTIFRYICQNYEKVTLLSKDSWPVYRYRGGP